MDTELEVNLPEIQDFYLKDHQGVQRFKTVSYDNNYFLDEIVEYREVSAHVLDTASKKRIKRAKQIFRKECENSSVSEIQRWIRLIEEASLTTFIVTTKTQATKVFAFQNDRGKKLSNLEKVKAYLMQEIYLAGPSKKVVNQNIIYLEDLFTKVYQQIERISTPEDEVLNYFWRSYSEKGYYSKDVSGEIHESIRGLKANRVEKIKDLVLGLSQACVSIETIENSNDPTVQCLHYLNNMAISYPFFLKSLRLGVSVEKIARLSRFLENLTFRYLLRGGRAEIESRLNPYLLSLSKPSEIDTVIDGMVKGLKSDWTWSYWNNDSMNAYLKGYMYGNRTDNYLLWKYELAISNSNHPKPHNIAFHDLIKDENIEHIAPKVPTNGDPVANGYGIYEDTVDASKGIVSGSWLNSIGNLMLISGHHNRVIGNKPFSSKVESYGAANLLNQQKEIRDLATKITGNSTNADGTFSEKVTLVWDVDSIKRRQKKIIDIANQIWNLDKI